MLKSFTANRLNVFRPILFLFFFSILAHSRLRAQLTLQSSNTQSGSAATVHALTSVPAGALLVVTTAAGSAQTNCTVTSSPSLTWSRRIEASAASSGDAEIFTAVFTAGGSISVTSNWGNQQQASVCHVVTGQESTLAGTTGSGTSQEFPSVAVTTTRANSILFCVTSDWNGNSGSTRTYRSSAVEKFYYFSSNNVTAYHYTLAAATAQAYTMGLTAPSMQKTSVNGGGTAVLEIRGPADTQAPTAPTLSSTGQTGTTISLSWTAATDNVGVTGYDVYVGGVLNGNTTNTTYTVTGLTPSTSYSIYVKAKDAASNGTNSNTITPSTISADFWSVTGNTGTDPATHFLGTTDAQPLVIKTNNAEVARVTTAGNIGIGTNNPTFKLDVNGSIRSTADATINLMTIGIGAGGVQYNTALGKGVLLANTSSGLYNTGVGYGALNVNTTGTANTAMGYASMLLNTTGDRNTSVGANTLGVNTAGVENTAMGVDALKNNTTGSQNTAVGHNSLVVNTTGQYNSAFGRSALTYSNASYNTAVGYGSQYNTSTGGGNTTIGSLSMETNTTGSNNTAGGYQSLNKNTSGVQNIALGSTTLFSNTTGSYNTAIGYDALRNTTSANSNIAIGHSAGNNLTAGSNNIFIGNSAQPNISATSSNQLNIGGWIYGNNGDIGIGVSAPSARLHSNGTLRFDGLANNDALTRVLTTDASGNVSWRNASTLGGSSGVWSLTGNSGTSPSTNFIGTTDAQPIIFKANNTEVMRVNPDQSILVNSGQNSRPAIFSSDYVYGTWLNVNNNSSYNATGSGIRITINNANKTQIFHNDNAFSLGGSFDVLTGNAEMLSRTGDVYLSTGNFRSNGIIVKNGTGYLGIGTTTPSTQLHTTGTVRFQGLTTNNTLANILAADANGNLSWRDASTLGSGGGYWVVSGNNISNNNSGLVVIGSMPTAAMLDDAGLKLAVNGNVYTKKVKVTPDEWADYVFHPGYKLPTLKEVEEFIQTNKHLMDVPSAAEVEKNGIDVGDNQAVLLKKIEELTLYLIEINKKVDKLSEENIQLKKKLEGVNK
jgi:hypothetical protein